MLIDDRRMCDRCGEEIFKGEDYYFYAEKEQELCYHCVKRELEESDSCVCDSCGMCY